MSGTSPAAQHVIDSDGSLLAQRAVDDHSHRDRTDVTKIKTEADGSLVRKASTFRNWIEAGGVFAPERGLFYAFSGTRMKLMQVVDRYHLYASYGCRGCSCQHSVGSG